LWKYLDSTSVGAVARELTNRGALIIAALVGLTGGALILALVGAPYIVVSPSMEPTINTGDLFWVRPVEGEIRPGMVVTYRMEGRIITHRVVAAEAETLVTQGDNNWAADPWSVPHSAVIGTPALRLPYLGWFIDFARRSTGGVLFALLLPGVLIAGEVVRLVYDRREAFPAVRRRWGVQLGEGPKCEGLAAWRSSVQALSCRRWGTDSSGGRSPHGPSPSRMTGSARSSASDARGPQRARSRG
jgi:signal peptidase I